jgi:hypothetical protein
MKPPHNKMSSEQEQLIIARYRAGEAASAIAQSLGLVKTSVYNVLRREGVEKKREIVKKRTRVPADRLIQSVDFWRGAVDGDGWLGTCLWNREKTVYPYVGLSGQALLIDAFRLFCGNRNLPVLQRVLTKSGIWRVETAGSGAQAIIETLYRDATVALDRKNKRAQAIIFSDRLELLPLYKEGPSCVRVDSYEEYVE